MHREFALSLTHPSIERSLKQYLCSIVKINSFSFYCNQSAEGIVYQSSVAVALAKGNLEKAQEINYHIISNLISINGQLELNFEVTINNSGLLIFFLNYSEINRWLQKLPELFLNYHTFSLSNHSLTEIDEQFFSLQYAHARCCSLLRSGHKDNLIQLKSLDFAQSSWLWLSPQPIPFAQIIWQQPEEQELIAQIIIIIDGLDSVNSIPARKLAANLSKAFFKFEQSCRIWGKVKRQYPTLAQARLGIIALVQLLLRFLLQEKLKFIPWTDF